MKNNVVVLDGEIERQPVRNNHQPPAPQVGPVYFCRRLGLVHGKTLVPFANRDRKGKKSPRGVVGKLF
jgi:hypothetical protein